MASQLSAGINVRVEARNAPTAPRTPKSGTFRIASNIEKRIEKVEEECDKAIESDDEMHRLSERFLRVKGVGPCLVRTVLASCPDIGDFNSKSIAKMSGNAPIDHRSCTVVRKSKPRRGRSDLKKAFYMAAVNASRSNHVLHETYQRLLSKGKPKKVALVAVARHLAVLLNYIAKYPDFEPEAGPKTRREKASALRHGQTKAK